MPSTPRTVSTNVRMPISVLREWARRADATWTPHQYTSAAIRSGYEQPHRWSQAQYWLSKLDPGQTSRWIDLDADIVGATTAADGVFDPYLLTAWLVIGLGILDEFERDGGWLPPVRDRFDIIEEASNG